MDSRWNVDGVLSFQRVPEEYRAFVQEKQLQLLFNVLSSAAAGVVLSNVVALVSGDASGALLADTLRTQIPLLALVGVASVASVVLRK